MEKDLKALTALVIISLITVPIGVFLNAYTLLCLWLWFIVPLGVPAIGLVHAMGIMLIKGFMMAKYLPKDQEEDEEPATKIGKLKGSLVFTYTMPIIALGVGYIFQSFM
jgi:hypothetical protein